MVTRLSLSVKMDEFNWTTLQFHIGSNLSQEDDCDFGLELVIFVRDWKLWTPATKKLAALTDAEALCQRGS